MGLGFVVLGYMTVISLMYPYTVMMDTQPYVSVVPVAGCVLLIYGLYKLSQSYKFAGSAAVGTVPLCLYAVFVSVRALLGLTVDGDAPRPLAIPVAYEVILQAALFMLLHVLLYGVLKKLCAELGDKKHAWKATRNTYIMYAYYALLILAVLPIPALEELMKVFTPIVMLLGLFWFITNILLIYGCYMKLSKTAIEIHKDL